MQRYRNNVQDLLGNAVEDAVIRVLLHGTSTEATIYSDNGSTVRGNPINAGTGVNLGEFDFYAANGRYDLEISGTGITPETISDILLFDSADIDFDGFGGIDTTGETTGDALVYNGTEYVPQTPIEAGWQQYFARVNEYTDGFMWIRRSVPDTSAVVDITQQGLGRIINFRQGVDDGSVVAYVTNLGGAYFDDDVIVNGDLTVNGTVTQINSTEVNIGDNVIVLNAGETGVPSMDAGFEVERGTSPNAAITWREATDRFKWTPDGYVTSYTIPGLELAETVSGDWNFTGALTAAGNAVWHQGNIGTQLNALTTDAAPDSAADFVMFYDASEGVANKVLIDDLLALGGGGGVTDHGALTGLADDDHTQYVLADGTRAMSGTLSVSIASGSRVATFQHTGASPAWISVRSNSSTQDAGVLFGDDASDYQGQVRYVNSDNSLRFYTAGASRVTLTSTLAMSGAITATGDITGNTSDGRLKTAFREFDSGRIVDAIVPGLHKFDPDKCEAAGFTEYDELEHFGFDARQVFKVMGEGAAPIAPFDRNKSGRSRSRKNFRTFKERELLAVAWAEIRALRRRVAKLEKVSA